MSVVIDMPGGLSDLEKVFDVSEFLENKDELISDFLPEVLKYTVRKEFFTGPFQKVYKDAFDDLIVSLIKRQLVKHFTNLTPEEVLLLCDKTFLKMIAGDLFEQDNYTSRKEVKQ